MKKIESKKDSIRRKRTKGQKSTVDTNLDSVECSLSKMNDFLKKLIEKQKIEITTGE